MNFIEVFIVCIVLFAGIFLSEAGAQLYGWLGGVVGFLLGLGFAIMAYNLLGWLIEWLCPTHEKPSCKNNKCPGQMIKIENYNGPHGKGLVKSCQCGRRYIMTKHDYLELSDDGSETSFMYREGWYKPWKLCALKQNDENG